MKTIQEINQEKQQLINDSKALGTSKKDKAIRKKNGNRVEFLNLMINYLELGVNADYIKKEKQRLGVIIKNCESKIKQDFMFPAEKTKFRKDSGSTLAKQHLNALNYIS